MYDVSDPIWLPKFFKLDQANAEITSEIRRYIELTQRDDDELTGDERQQRERIEDFITQRFVNDIGNFVLLHDRDNLSASNRPLAEKIPEYFNEAKEFSSIHPNRYFTSERGPINQSHLEQLIQHSKGSREETKPVFETTEYFNSFWTYDSLKERRADLIIDVLESVSFEGVDDEFGLETSPERVAQEIRTHTESEFENRLSMRTL
ncbi:GmrSD restriction endonuclease domain-containing protein [Halococcus sp. AFM35]|uniref:GmrSD restriction endonuclease domain-containing protein n=1 Tax=Halococcus sp. AFM35 TaxID=3421653 RepID=UPI003EB9B151